jgi:uncharacterized repeat protein (TIGR01451 family)
VKTKYSKVSLASLCVGAALTMAALAPSSASAATVAAPGSAANAKILNVVTVTYFDATGSVSHKAATSTSVTVDLKQSPLNVTVQQPFGKVDSGATTLARLMLTATANGGDSYKVTLGDTGTNLQSSSVTGAMLTDIGATGASYTSGVPFNLGATSIVSVAAAAGTTQTITIPGGALNGIVVGSIVVIKDNSYKVTAVDPGAPASYSTTDGTTEGTLTPESMGSITISSDDNGSKTTPALAAGTGLAGTIIGERKYLELSDKSVVSSNTADGTDVVSVSTATTTNSGANTTVLEDQTATFYHVSLRIDKSVRNVTNSAATGTGKPLDVLEYTVTVTNTATGNAGKVSIADAVPAYTTLISGSSYGSGGGTGNKTEIFATIYDGTNTVNCTLDPSDSESQPGGSTYTGFGGTANNAVTAGTAINFYLGTGSAPGVPGAGGTVAATKVYTIKYQVKIN